MTRPEDRQGTISPENEKREKEKQSCGNQPAGQSEA